MEMYDHWMSGNVMEALATLSDKVYVKIKGCILKPEYVHVDNVFIMLVILVTHSVKGYSAMTILGNCIGLEQPSLSVSHDGPGAKIIEKMAPGPYIMKRTGSRFPRTGSHSPNQENATLNSFQTSYSYLFSISGL